MKYQLCRVRVFEAFLGMFFQLAVCPFNWVDEVRQDVSEKVVKALHDHTVESCPDQTKEDDIIGGPIGTNEEVPIVDTQSTSKGVETGGMRLHPMRARVSSRARV
jgi:hypothetical protein